MSIMKKTVAAVLMLIMLSVSAAGLAWHTRYYCIVDFKVYPRDAAVLDLREEEISAAHYRKLSKKLPHCRILWNIPLQGGYYSQDTETLQLNRLSSRDLEVLQLFPNLKSVDARGCTDYANLLQLQQLCPEVQVRYTVSISGKEYAQDTRTVTVDGITGEEVTLLACLPQLEQVRIDSGRDEENLAALTQYCRENGIPVSVKLGERYYDDTAASISVTGLREEEASLLSWLPQLQSVTLTDPQGEADTLFAMMDALPNVKFTWNKSVLGVLFPSDTEVIDLTETLSSAGAAAYAKAKTDSVQGDRDEETYMFAIRDNFPLPDMTGDTGSIIAQLEAELAYFPNLQKVLVCGGILDNEAMAAFRERQRESYKVVWTVQCGKMAVRTDAPYFMPTKYHVYYFHDEDAVNLRYCEDMICVDLGHMTIRSIDWVQYMPELTYLVLAHTDVRSIEPISSCKKLKFLELDWSAVPDYTPLKECTALEDLNLGNTNRDFTPIGEMTWLKNLWMVGCSSGAAYRMTQALPNTKIVASGSATVAGGWRELPNYYAMRDTMNMFYMEW